VAGEPDISDADDDSIRHHIEAYRRGVVSRDELHERIERAGGDGK
jgi:hypothetical protein